jgi:hypothetical protein
VDVLLMTDINEAAEKKLKSRIRKIKKCNKDDEEKQKFANQLGTSFEVFFPNRNPDKLTDGLTLFTSPEGKVLFADYFYQIPEEEDANVTVQVPEKDLKVILEFFEEYKLQLDDSD